MQIPRQDWRDPRVGFSASYGGVRYKDIRGYWQTEEGKTRNTKEIVMLSPLLSSKGTCFPALSLVNGQVLLSTPSKANSFDSHRFHLRPLWDHAKLLKYNLGPHKFQN